MTALSSNLGDKIYLSKKAQIAHLQVDKIFIKVLSKYANFKNVFSRKLVIKFSDYIDIVDHTIELIND